MKPETAVIKSVTAGDTFLQELNNAVMFEEDFNTILEREIKGEERDRLDMAKS
ncbi:MAG: hypothetical protein IJJ13_05230 [Lachnospiraceae bacterium]|nr:hypothetical protein [Lachnospiraceae bacterium]